MSIELIGSGTLKPAFVNSYITVVKVMLKKPKKPKPKKQHMFLMILFSRICTDLLTFRQGSAWIAPKSSIKFSFQSVTPAKQRKNGKWTTSLVCRQTKPTYWHINLYRTENSLKTAAIINFVQLQASWLG